MPGSGSSMSTAPRERRQDERRVGDRGIFEELLARLERRHDGLDRLAVADHVVRGDRTRARRRRRAGSRRGSRNDSATWRASAQRPSASSASVAGVAADRGLGGRRRRARASSGRVGSTLASSPASSEALSAPIGRPQASLVAAGVPAFAPARGRAAEPLARPPGSPAISSGERGGVGRVAPGARALARPARRAAPR